MILKKIWLVILCILLTAVAHSAIKMQPEVGFDGYYKSGAWTILRVILENDGPKSFEGTLVATAPMYGYGQNVEFRKPITLPASSKKKFEMLIKISGSQQPIKININDNKGKSVLEEDVPIHAANSYDPLIVILSDDNFNIGLASGKFGQGDIRVANTNGAGMPGHWKGYDGVDLLILHNVWMNQLDADQVKALLTWVKTGGHLVVSADANVDKLRQKDFESILPVSLSHSKEISSLALLGDYYGSPLPSSGAVIVADSQLKFGKSMLSSGNIPLIVNANVGNGKVTYLAFDVGKPPIQGWNGNETFWKSFLSTAQYQQNNNNQGQPTFESQIQNALLSYIGTPSLAFIMTFLIFYILILGPLNYVYLRRKKKLEAAWITIPVIVVVFTISAYVIGIITKGTSLVLEDISILNIGGETDTGKIHHFFGLSSPRKVNYTIGLKDPFSLQPVIEEYEPSSSPTDMKYANIEETDKIRLMDVPFTMWSMKLFHAQTPVPVGDGFPGELTRTGDHVEGTITNKTPYLIKNAHLVLLDTFRCYALGDLKQDQKSTVQFDVTSLPPISTVYAQQTADTQSSWKSMLTDNIFNSNQFGSQSQDFAVVEGYLDNQQTSNTPVDLNLELRHAPQKTNRLTLLIAKVPIRLQTNTLHISKQLSEATFSKQSAKIFTFNPKDPWNPQGSLDLGDGYCVLQFVLNNSPTPLGKSELTLHVTSNPLAPPPNSSFQNLNRPPLKIELYDWSKNKWESINGFNVTSNSVQPHVSPSFPGGNNNPRNIPIATGSMTYKISSSDKYIKSPLGICKIRLTMSPAVSKQGDVLQEWINETHIQNMDLTYDGNKQ